ncbi:MAG: NineTeen Complex (NTC) component [Chaenotheca gracillima]|nr:MAG: NineTeen Complex (NTC) component [Chaenotheca gracillima]
MQWTLLTAALCGSAALAAPELEKRQATNEADFNSAVSQLLGLYIPSAVSASLVNAISSAASITGDANDIVHSAFAAATPPAYLTQVPSQYLPNVISLESAISGLRGVAATGIAGAPIITTDGSGATVTSIKASATPSGGASGSGSSISRSGQVVTTDDSGKTITGLAATSTDSAGSTITSLTTTFPVAPVPLGSGGSAVSSALSSGAAGASSLATSLGAGASSAASSAAAGASSLLSSAAAGASSLTSSAAAGASSLASSGSAAASSASSSGAGAASSATAAAAPSSSSAAANPIAVGPMTGGVLAFIGMFLAL